MNQYSSTQETICIQVQQKMPESEQHASVQARITYLLSDSLRLSC